jgi:hypothetical protein
VAQTTFVFGRESDDLLVAPTAAAALEHARGHAKGKDVLELFEFFDDAGRPLAPGPGKPGKLEPMGYRRYLEHRVRLQLSRSWADASEADRQRHAELIGAFLDGDLDFETLVSRMALASTPKNPKHSRGGLHNLCHRVHLC